MFIINYGTVIDPLLRDVREFVPRYTGMNAGDRVLDVCCGTGAQVLEYGRLGIRATGIDIDPSMLQTASKNRTRDDLTATAFILGNAACLPFPDNHFDYASVTFGLHDKERSVRNDIISEMKRVVSRDGFLVLADFQVPLPRNVWALFVRIIEFIAGGSHYRGFRDYVKSGGLEEILRNHHLQESGRAYLKSGLILVVKAGNSRKSDTTASRP
ncbi:MAG TPA: methyltransferase domain-containing protein [Dehalococcoidia bacterium]|nr:methyltransferase domain-containing protein [Dehalococcoidia bacterium]